MASQSLSPLNSLDKYGIQVMIEQAASNIQPSPFVPTGPNDNHRYTTLAAGSSTTLVSLINTHFRLI